MKTRKWKRYWISLGILIAIQISLVVWYEVSDTRGLKIIIETLWSACGLFLALIIFLQSQESSATYQHHIMSQREALHKEQIRAILDGNKLQSDALKKLLHSQNKTLTETLSKLLKSTYKEDKSFENSMRIYEISRIDALIAGLEYQLNEAYFELAQVKEWQFLRTPEEKIKQIKKQKKKITNLQDAKSEQEIKRKDLEKGSD